MATFLDALADLVSDPSARTAYRLDPPGWLAGHDGAELCAEDVRAAEPVLRRWFPGAALTALLGLAPHSGPEVTDLDAAIVAIDHLVSGLAEDPDGRDDPDPDDGGGDHDRGGDDAAAGSSGEDRAASRRARPRSSRRR